MLKVDVTIRGSFPLIVNRFHEDSATESTSGVHGRQERLGPEDDAKSRLYLHNGEPYFPAENLRQSIITASSRTKIGRRSATTDVAAALYVSPDRLTLIGNWHVDSRAVVIPATKGRIIRHRPMFDEWEIRCVIEIEESLLDAATIRKIVEDSGNFVGLGDFRPAKRGPYGRFAIVSWQPIAEQPMNGLADKELVASVR